MKQENDLIEIKWEIFKVKKNKLEEIKKRKGSHRRM